MDISSKVAGYIRTHGLIEDGDTIIVGVSGGADSLGLLFLLHEMELKQGIELRAVHVNHGIRGAMADGDEAFTLAVCARLGVPCSVVRADVPAMAEKSGESLEEAGRRARYEAFRKAAQEAAAGGGRVRVAVAHHLDDQAETVIHNLIRGTGIGGMKGMSPVCPLPYKEAESSDGGESIAGPDIRLIRPLLCVRRREIEAWLSDRQEKWRTDETNLTEDYTRNRIRHVMMRAAEEINDRAAEHMGLAAQKLARIDDYLEKKTAEAMGKYVTGAGDCVTLDTAVFEAEHEVIAERILRECIRQTAGRLKDIGEVHIEAVRRLGTELSSGRRICLPYGIIVTRNYGKLYFETGERRAEGGVRMEFREFTRREGKVCFPKDSCIKWFDCDKIKGRVRWRHRESGDYIVTAAGRQKIKDFFIKQKLDSRLRSEAWLLVDEYETGGSEVLWVYANDLSRMNVRYMIGEDTERILEARIIYERGEENTGDDPG